MRHSNYIWNIHSYLICKLDFSSRMTFVLLVAMLWLCHCSSGESSESSLGPPLLSGPSEAMVGDIVYFNCYLQTYPKNESILLQLFKEGHRDKYFSEYTSLAGEKASFPVVIKLLHNGSLECVAKGQNNSNIEPTVSNRHHLRVIEKVKDAQIDLLSNLEKIFVGEPLNLHCSVGKGNYVSYSWWLNGQLVSPSSPQHDYLFINRTSSEDSGSYMCTATNFLNKTLASTANSTEVLITVKDVVSNLKISFAVLKEGPLNYSVMVTCQSTKGTPPIIFSLNNSIEQVANTTVKDRDATFKVPLVLGQRSGWFQCQANNGDRTAYSEWIPIEVVPVGGPVTMNYDYDVEEDHTVSRLRFYCKAAKGSLPRYQWFLNNAPLHGRGSFYRVVDQLPERSMLMLSVGRSSAGTYHCEVSDSFDNATAISSKSQYIDRKVLNRLPLLVQAVVFGCFAFLVLLIAACCLIGVLKRRRQKKEVKPLRRLKMYRTLSADDSELELFTEGADLIGTVGGGEFDQASEASEDEWLQIAEEKKTLEDEPAEEP